MSTPAGMRLKPFSLVSGDAIHVYSDAERTVIQLRRRVATERELTAPSFKVATELTAAEALAIAGELLSAAARQIDSQNESFLEPAS